MNEETPVTFIPPWIIKRFPRLADAWFGCPMWLHQAVKFGVVGGINTAVDWGIYWLLTRTVPFMAATPVFAKTISYTVGVINSFIWNKNFTFRAKHAQKGTFILFFAINLLAIGINSAVMAFGYHSLNLSEFMSLILATLCTLLWNFLTSKFIVFKQ
jgi:putative flippase GtrA